MGRRWDMDIQYLIDFKSKWTTVLEKQATSGGRRRGVDAIDYFAFRNGTFPEIPRFAIGRSAWDNWLITDALHRGVQVVDASMVVHPVHQEIPASIRHQKTTPQRAEQHANNRRLYDARPSKFRGITREAQWVLTPDGSIVRRGNLDF